SQSPLGARVPRTIMWAKLKVLAEGAQLASRALWGSAPWRESPIAASSRFDVCSRSVRADRYRNIAGGLCHRYRLGRGGQCRQQGTRRPALGKYGCDRDRPEIRRCRDHHHMHPDQINGPLRADGTLAFPNAEVLVPAAERAFWFDDGEK